MMVQVRNRAGDLLGLMHVGLIPSSGWFFAEVARPFSASIDDAPIFDLPEVVQFQWEFWTDFPVLIAPAGVTLEKLRTVRGFR